LIYNRYSRRHGGGGGVPHTGGYLAYLFPLCLNSHLKSNSSLQKRYPLGLDWEYDKEHVLKRGLTEFEELRQEERHEKGDQ
jgi:hypothetical protein